MSTSLQGLKIFFKTLIDAEPWVSESPLVPLPYNNMKCMSKGTKLKIGVIWHDGIVKPHPPITRGLKEVVLKLKSVAGVEVVDWPVYRHDLAWEIISSLYFTDGGLQEEAELSASGEPMRPLTHWLLKETPAVKRLNMEELWEWQQKREIYEEEYNKLWTAGSDKSEDMIDIILCPVYPSASTIFDTAKYWAYTATWNLLDYPSLVFPVSRADPELDPVEKNFKPMTEQDEQNHRLCKIPGKMLCTY